MTATLTRMGRPKKSEPTEPLRLPASVVRRIRRIATHLGMDPGDYVADRFRSQLDRDESKMMQEIERERADAKNN